MLLDEFLNLPEIRAKGLQLAVQTFISRLGAMSHPPEADVEADRPLNTWPSYDPVVDDKWAEIVPREAAAAARSPNIPDANSSLTVKPSFSLHCLNWIQWHWPPFTTLRSEFGETADQTNPCTRQQFEKFPLSSGKFFTSDRIWRRFRRTVHDPKPYEKTSHEFQAVQEELHDFLWAENRSPVVLILGERNVTSFPKTRKNCIGITIPGPKMYRQSPKLWLLLNPADSSIERLVLTSYHPEMVFRNMTPTHAAQMDWSWNLMAALGNLPFVNQTYFQWKASQETVAISDNGLPVFRGTVLSTLFSIMAWEESTGNTLAVKNMPFNVRVYMEQQAVLLKENKSVAVQLLSHMRKKGLATQGAAGFPNLAIGRATQRAAGFPSLAIGLATRRAAGFPSLAIGRATQRAAGFPSLAIGNATQRAAGFPALAKGLATQRAAGFPALAKGLATNRAAGFPGLAKGRATQRAAGFPGLAKGLATNRAAGFPGLAKGRAANAANGHPNARKAREAQAANGYQSLRKGDEARTAKAVERDLEFSPKTREKRVQKRARARSDYSRKARSKAEANQEGS